MPLARAPLIPSGDETRIMKVASLRHGKIETVNMLRTQYIDRWTSMFYVVSRIVPDKW